MQPGDYVVWVSLSETCEGALLIISALRQYTCRGQHTSRLDRFVSLVYPRSIGTLFTVSGWFTNAIEACPLTEQNAEYLARQRHCFLEGSSAIPAYEVQVLK